MIRILLALAMNFELATWVILYYYPLQNQDLIPQHQTET